jgi:cell division septation protein DedD
VLIAGGFALGLVAGVVSEEPELVVGHLVGRSEEVAWAPEGEAEFTLSSDEEIAPVELVEPLELAELSLGSEEILPEGVVYLEEADVIIDVPEPALPAVAAAPPARRPGARPIDALPAAPPASRAYDPPAPPAHAGFAVQVGAFTDGSSAEDIRQKLRSKGYDSYVIPASEAGDGKWRVRVGPVATKAAAESLASRLKSEERLPTWVLSEGGG